MKIYKITFISLTFLFQINFLIGQLPPSAFNYIDINNINARINSGGDHFYDFNSNSKFEVPKNSGKHTIGSFGFWIGGLDLNNQLSLAGQLNRENGWDFYTGPLSTDGLAQCEDPYCAIWDRLWRVTRAEVDNHVYNYNMPGYIPPADIEEWPAHGDVSYPQAFNIAPFVDKNNDGVYNCYDGDYPAIRGDLAFYHVYNENTLPHTLTGGWPIGVEVQSMVYGFDCPEDSVFNNTIFKKLIIINRGTSELHDTYIGFFVDFNIGYEKDDFIGCDTANNFIYGYNGNSSDMIYGDHPPAQALCILNDTIDRFMYTNDILVMSDPLNAHDYYNYMQCKWRDNSQLVFGGNGHEMTGGTEPTYFAFPGDPNEVEEWSEVSSGNSPNERKGIASFGPFTLEPGMTKEIDLAFIFACDYEGTNLSSVELLKSRVEELKIHYEEGTTPCGSAWSGITKKRQSEYNFQVYPNPVNHELTIQSKTNAKSFKYEIIDLTGGIIKKGVGENSFTTIKMSNIPNGYYMLRISGKYSIENYKIVKL